MEMIEKIIEALNKEMSLPIPYGRFSEGWLQYITIFLVIILSYYTVKWFRKSSDCKLRTFILMTSLLFMLLELYKQLLLSYQEGWIYPWRAFPFQFCSTPMYGMFLAGLLSRGKIQNALYGFLATYGLLAGLTVIFLPGTVFSTNVGINIHTLIHHGGMVIIGITLLSRYPNIIRKSFLGSTIVFGILVIMAIGFNFWHNTIIGVGEFNMFFINSRYEMPDQWMILVQENTTHPVFIGFYVFGFTLAAYFVLEVALSFIKNHLEESEPQKTDS